MEVMVTVVDMVAEVVLMADEVGEEDSEDGGKGDSEEGGRTNHTAFMEQLGGVTSV